MNRRAAPKLTGLVLLLGSLGCQEDVTPLHTLAPPDAGSFSEDTLDAGTLDLGSSPMGDAGTADLGRSRDGGRLADAGAKDAGSTPPPLPGAPPCFRDTLKACGLRMLGAQRQPLPRPGAAVDGLAYASGRQEIFLLQDGLLFRAQQDDQKPVLLFTIDPESRSQRWTSIAATETAVLLANRQTALHVDLDTDVRTAIPMDGRRVRALSDGQQLALGGDAEIGIFDGVQVEWQSVPVLRQRPGEAMNGDRVMSFYGTQPPFVAAQWGNIEQLLPVGSTASAAMVDKPGKAPTNFRKTSEASLRLKPAFCS